MFWKWKAAAEEVKLTRMESLLVEARSRGDLVLNSMITAHNKGIVFLFPYVSSAYVTVLGENRALEVHKEALLKLCLESPAYLFAIYAFTFLVVIKLTQKLFFQRQRGKPFPQVQGGYPFLGQVFTMIKGSPWDTMCEWTKRYGGVYSFILFGEESISVSDPEILKGILHTKHTIFKKDLAWTYKPFLEILGNGLVTSDGESWRRQRTLLSKHLRVDILDEIPEMAYRAVQRLCIKLDAAVKSGKTVEMAEEFRTLTLQVIAEALLSLEASESDETFAHMYLPIVEEGNLRTWNPTRNNIFIPAFWSHLHAVKKLNDYVTGLIKKRWNLRKMEEAMASNNESSTRKHDVLDKILAAIKPEDWDSNSTDIIEQIRDEIKTFVLAGHETSASMLAWTLYELNNAENGPKTIKTYRVIYPGGCYTRTAPDVTDETNRIKLLEVGDLVEIECLLEDKNHPESFYRLSHGNGYIRACKNGKEVLEIVVTRDSNDPDGKRELSCLDQVLNEANKVYAGHMDDKGYVTSMPTRSVLAGEREATKNDYRGLDFTECCLRESLRKYSVVPTVVRNVSEDTMIGPYFFEKGKKIMVNMQGAHHTAENWPEPDCYRPSRFNGDNLERRKPYTFIAFIDGPRNCLGQFLSLLESKCVLSMLVKRYKFELTNPDTAGMKHPFMVPIIPGPGHNFKVYDR